MRVPIRIAARYPPSVGTTTLWCGLMNDRTKERGSKVSYARQAWRLMKHQRHVAWSAAVLLTTPYLNCPKASGHGILNRPKR